MIRAHAKTRYAAPRYTLVAVVAWLIEADRRYRDRRHMAELSDDALSDVGLRRDASGEIVRR